MVPPPRCLLKAHGRKKEGKRERWRGRQVMFHHLEVMDLGATSLNFSGGRVFARGPAPLILIPWDRVVSGVSFQVTRAYLDQVGLKHQRQCLQLCQENYL